MQDKYLALIPRGVKDVLSAFVANRLQRHQSIDHQLPRAAVGEGGLDSEECFHELVKRILRELRDWAEDGLAGGCELLRLGLVLGLEDPSLLGGAAVQIPRDCVAIMTSILHLRLSPGP